MNFCTEQAQQNPLKSPFELTIANKMGKIPVAYLTAYDENIIISPNLYRDGTFLDYLLKAKILDPVINPDDLLPGDRDAIILWLRATGYGNEFPVNVTDNETGREFNSVVDLSKIGYKEFTLKGDENGYFDFTLPISKDKIKFRFLTHADIKQIEEIDKEEQNNVKKELVFAAETKVRVADMSEREIQEYISLDEPYDKAGAYAIQGYFAKHIEKFEGDYDNVVGFPWKRIEEEVKKLAEKMKKHLGVHFEILMG